MLMAAQSMDQCAFATMDACIFFSHHITVMLKSILYHPFEVSKIAQNILLINKSVTFVMKSSIIIRC